MNNIDIKIQYRLHSSDEWYYLELTPGEYFELEVDEYPSIEAIPIHDHVAEYINYEARSIRNTVVVVLDTEAQKSYTISETFWNNGQNRIIERVDKDRLSDANSTDWEIIVNSLVELEDCSRPHMEVLRLSRNAGSIVPVFHGFYRRNQDGSEIETKVDLETVIET